MVHNRVYIGEAVHKGTSYPGEHKAIVEREAWDSVQFILTESPRSCEGCSTDLMARPPLHPTPARAGILTLP